MTCTPTAPHARQPRRPFAAPVAILAPATLALLSLVAQFALRADEPRPVRPQLLREHQGIVIDVAFSPDGGFVVTGSDDGTAVVRDASTGSCLQVLSPSNGRVLSVALSERARFAAIGTLGEVVTVWDVASGREIRRLPMPRPDDRPRKGNESESDAPRSFPYAAMRVSIDPDGRRVVAVAHRVAAAFDVREGRLDRSLPLTGRETAVALGRSGRHLVVASPVVEGKGTRLAVYRTSDFQRIAEIPTDGSEIWRSDASDHAGTATLGNDERLVVRDLRSGRIVAERAGRFSFAEIRSSADGRTMHVDNDEMGECLWTVGPEGLRRGAELSGLGRRAVRALSDDGRQLVAATWDSKDEPEVALYDVERRAWRWNRSGRPPKLGGFAVGSSRPVLYGVADQRKAFRWDVEDADHPQHIVLAKDAAAANSERETVAASSDGRQALLVLSFRGAFRLRYDARTNATDREKVLPMDGNAKAVAIDRSGTRLAVGYYDGRFTVQDTSGRTITVAPRHEAGAVSALSIDPTGRWMVVGWSKGLVRAYSFDRPTRIFDLQDVDEGSVVCLALDEAREALIVGRESGHLSNWSPANGKRLWSVDCGGNGPSVVSLSDDARTVTAGTAWGEVLVVDVASGRTKHSARAHDGGLVGLGFESGRRLWTAGADGFVKVWTADAARELARVAFLADGGWIVQTPDGRFDGSPGCEKHVAFVETGTLRVRTEDGLAARFRRPGLLKEVLREHDAQRE